MVLDGQSRYWKDFYMVNSRFQLREQRAKTTRIGCYRLPAILAAFFKLPRPFNCYRRSKEFIN